MAAPYRNGGAHHGLRRLLHHTPPKSRSDPSVARARYTPRGARSTQIMVAHCDVPLSRRKETCQTLGGTVEERASVVPKLIARHENAWTLLAARLGARAAAQTCNGRNITACFVGAPQIPFLRLGGLRVGIERLRPYVDCCGERTPVDVATVLCRCSLRNPSVPRIHRVQIRSDAPVSRPVRSLATK